MDLVDSLLDANEFTKLDLRNAYGNLWVAKGDEDKLAFICKAGQFAPLTMPFGPTGAPGYFQFFIQDIMVGQIGKDVAAYLDNIMIYTQPGADHTAAVTSVLEVLSKHNLWLKPEKCKFLRPEVEYLGPVILRFSNFYRRFIGHFSGTARPLHDLTKKAAQFVWDDRCGKAFEALKTAFTTAPVLKIANPYCPFVLECDCLNFVLGAVLSQVCDSNGKLHPVVFLSRSLVQAEKNYEVFDKELLAIVVASKEWRQYLEGNPHRLTAVVYTDHRNLESLMTIKELTRQQARWAETLGCFNFEIIFCPGRQSGKPDALLRQPNLALQKGKKRTFGQVLKTANITSKTFAEVAEIDSFFVDKTVLCKEAERWFQVNVLGVEEGSLDEEAIDTDNGLIKEIWKTTPMDERLQELLVRPTAALPEGITTADGLVYNQGRIEVPTGNDIRRQILRSRHDNRLAGHPGRARTLALVRRCFTWPSLKKFVNQYVDGCDLCQ
ncbi:hypothetical protein PCANC_27366 [Puccinia coronata f. sp. avenae]|uniref:Reverse transcriptase domain-containing protein n=1 Tax=Puccinia coronata f. sp. avenae TaxID=200324 RepID=A0A2N5TL01_9BASI|nr:hypothetical protein PCANC_27366 [Puccinia coronata f. sp. avenae]